MEKQVTPVHIMKEIDRLFAKLKEHGLTEIDLTVVREASVVENQLKVRWSLKAGDKTVAKWIFTDNRPLTEIKAEAETRKQQLQEKIAPDLAELDEVITKTSE